MRKFWLQQFRQVLAGVLTAGMIMTPIWNVSAREFTETTYEIAEYNDELQDYMQQNQESEEQVASEMFGQLELDEDEQPQSLHPSAQIYSLDDLQADAASTLPAAYRNTQMPAVRNQNPYNMCWAFSTIALIEINLIKKGLVSTDIDLSEAQLAGFTYRNVEDSLGGKKGDVNRHLGSQTITGGGGNISIAINSLLDWQGLTTEEQVQLSKQNVQLINGEGLDSTLAYSDNYAHVQNFYSINASSRDDIKKAILNYGAVYRSYYAVTGSSQYFNPDTAAYYYPEENGTNHAVTFIGWDDNFSKDNFNIQPEGDGAWIVRNSWGNRFGQDGYFYLSYYDKTMYKTAYALEAEMADNYDNNYQYDGAFVERSVPAYSNKDITAANVFTVKANQGGNEELQAVEFNVSGDTDVDYTIQIYTDLTDASDPFSGTLAATQQGQTTYEGTYTVKLNEKVLLKTGSKYAVVVALDNESGKREKQAYLKMEYTRDYSWYGCTAEAQENESFFYDNYRKEWLDYGIKYGGNIVIKAFTNNVEFQPLTAGIRADATSIAAGKNVTVTASADGGTGVYSYRYLLYNPSTKGWTELQEYSKESTYVWKAAGEGARHIYVDVRDSNGTTKRSKAFGVKVIQMPTVTLKGSASQMTAGGSVKMTATAQNGSGTYTYRFLLYNPADKTWTTLRDYRADSVYTWKAQGTGARHIYVDVKDSKGTVARSKAYGIKVVSAPTVTVKTNQNTVATGHNVTVTATGSQGSGRYTYRFLLYNPATKNWAILQDYNVKNTYTWKSTGLGARHIYVDIKDSNGVITRSRPYGIRVVNAPAVTVKASQSTVYAGKSVTVTATGSSGSGSYTYRFLLYNPTTKSWTVLRNYSAKNTYIWTATGTGARHMYVDIKDSNGIITRSRAYGIRVLTQIAAK